MKGCKNMEIILNLVLGAVYEKTRGIYLGGTVYRDRAGWHYGRHGLRGFREHLTVGRTIQTGF